MLRAILKCLYYPATVGCLKEHFPFVFALVFYLELIQQHLRSTQSTCLMVICLTGTKTANKALVC